MPRTLKVNSLLFFYEFFAEFMTVEGRTLAETARLEPRYGGLSDILLFFGAGSRHF